MIKINLENDDLFDKLTEEETEISNESDKEKNKKQSDKEKNKKQSDKTKKNKNKKENKKQSDKIKKGKLEIEDFIKKLDNNKYALIKKEPYIVYISKMNIYGLSFDKNIIQNDFCEVYLCKRELENFLNNKPVKNYKETSEFYFNNDGDVKEKSLNSSIIFKINRKFLNFNYSI